MTTDKSNAAPDPQPAELAEQGVDAHTLWAMAQLAPGEGIEDGVQRIEEALAATGKQQVGEVQGDARAQFEAWAHAQSYRGGNIITDRDADHPDVYACPNAQLTWQCWKAALAARQPVGEVIEYQSYHGYGGGKWSTCDKKLYDNGKAFEAKYGAGQMPLYRALVVGYAAPPAQGIDLGQFRTQVAELLRMEFDLEVADPEDHRHDDGASEAERIASKIAGLIGQRDAAPGVGNG